VLENYVGAGGDRTVNVKTGTMLQVMLVIADFINPLAS
jgi:hypothetical protein